ncbi:MAG: Flp pilus assembly complex ATPase component TadA, partial [Myxococcales bacterium]|nr:Flp pilus assembly complex ATPase component TadA [Myxococcales bacterium]
MSFDRQVVHALVDEGLVTDADLARAEAQAEEKGVSLPEALTGMRVVDHDHILKATARQLGLEFRATLDIDEIEVDLTLDLRSSFTKEQRMLPLWHKGVTIEVGISDPLNLDGLDSLRLMFGVPLVPIIVPERVLLDAINKVFDRRAGAAKVLEGMDEEQVVNVDASDEGLDFDIDETDDEAPIIRLVNSVLAQAVRDRASDIHIEPFERHIAIRFRVDGVLYEIAQPPKRFHASVSSRVKVMAGLDIAEKRIPQDGRIKLKVAGREIDIRLSTLPTSFGERIVMRLLDKTAVLKDLEHIGMGASVLDHVNDVITRSYGIILVTGPTGSGK